jgi:hypothetical protein
MVEKQNTFLLMIAKLITKANELGYKVTAGEFGRSEEIAKIYAAQGKGISNSLHISRLAADINVFKNGKWLIDGADYEDLGKYWESLGGTWGQRFLDSRGKPKPDGNHFSLAHNGVK